MRSARCSLDCLGLPRIASDCLGLPLVSTDCLPHQVLAGLERFVAADTAELQRALPARLNQLDRGLALLADRQLEDREAVERIEPWAAADAMAEAVVEAGMEVGLRRGWRRGWRRLRTRWQMRRMGRPWQWWRWWWRRWRWWRHAVGFEWVVVHALV